MKNTSISIISLFSFLFLYSEATIQAQDAISPKSTFGLRAGGNANSWTNEFPYQEVNNVQVYPDKWVTTFGYHAGIYANIRVSQWIALEPALLYTLKGTGTSREEQGVIGEVNFETSYLDIPVLFRLYVADGFNLFAGPQFSYLLSATYDFIIDGEKILDDQDTKDDIKEYDASLVLGLGYEFENGFNINLGGELGFITIDAYDELSTFNRNIRLSIGYTF